MEFFRKKKPVKIRGRNEPTKHGIAVATVKELLEKGCELLKLDPSDAYVCLYDDGTIVTEKFFKTLPNNSELVVLSGDQTWTGFVHDVGQLLSTVLHSDGLTEAARGLLSDEPAPKRRKILNDLLLNLEDRSELEKREQDEDWFKGIPPRFKTKSAYMKHNCAMRMRSYMTVVESSQTTLKNKVRERFLEASDFLKDKLKAEGYNGHYFDRTDKKPDRLCTQEGWFSCQGAFDTAMCQSFHSINPYSSYENRIIFSTWNLDHRIEKSKVISTLKEVLQKDKLPIINLEYFYRLLFTRDNLKLVHIVCHKKGDHNLDCDPMEIFEQTAATSRKRICRK